MVPHDFRARRSLTNELNVQMNGWRTNLLISHERIGVLGFWGIDCLLLADTFSLLDFF